MRRAVIIDPVRCQVRRPVRWKSVVLTASVLLLLLLQFPALLGAQQARPDPPKPAPDAAPADRKPSPLGFGVGVALERRLASDPHASDEWGVSFLPRFIARGLGPAVNLPWTQVGIVRDLEPKSAELGVIRMRPTMAGVAWQESIGKGLVAEVRFVAGYSFNSLRSPEKTRRDAQVAIDDAVTDVDDNVVWEPRIALWRELGPRVGLMVAGRYLHSRPKLTFADGTKRSWNADRVTIEIGIAFTLVKGPKTR